MNELAVHADWCNAALENDRECDCGGTGGACPVCGEQGPCGFTEDGEPLICVQTNELA